MGEKKDQIIAVFTTLSPSDKNLILNGIKLATTFKKELCLVYRLKRKEAEKRHLFQQKLAEYTLPLTKNIPGIKTSVLVMQDRVRDVPEILADDYEAILLIAEAAKFKEFSKAISESPVPFLFVNSSAPVSSFRKIVFPIDLRKENSDTSLWCSWFGRFFHSGIVAIAANEKRREAQRMVAKNVGLTKRLFQKFGIAHKMFKGRKSSLGNSFEALDFALSSDTELLVLLGSSVITPLDLLVGLPERKIIRRAGSLPVLIVNPRRYNYILCD